MRRWPGTVDDPKLSSSLYAYLLLNVEHLGPIGDVELFYEFVGVDGFLDGDIIRGGAVPVPPGGEGLQVLVLDDQILWNTMTC